MQTCFNEHCSADKNVAKRTRRFAFLFQLAETKVYIVEQKAESIQLRNVSCKIFRPCRGKVHPKALEGTKQTFQQAKLATMTKLWDFFALSVTAFELHVWPGRKTNSFKPIDNNAERENAIILTHYKQWWDGGVGGMNITFVADLTSKLLRVFLEFNKV
ncbi:hypothetical protein D918_09020 [Trichuris suis]|nr:hypothetical protein D918_09020 [Trichuris suis]